MAGIQYRIPMTVTSCVSREIKADSLELAIDTLKAWAKSVNDQIGMKVIDVTIDEENITELRPAEWVPLDRKRETARAIKGMGVPPADNSELPF